MIEEAIIIPAKIAGVFKYPEGKPALKALRPGDTVKAIPEPTNAYDPNAIRLCATTDGRDITLGYVPRAVAMTLKGKKFTVKKGIEWDAISIEVATPESPNEQAT